MALRSLLNRGNAAARHHRKAGLVRKTNNQIHQKRDFSTMIWDFEDRKGICFSNSESSYTFSSHNARQKKANHPSVRVLETELGVCGGPTQFDIKLETIDDGSGGCSDGGGLTRFYVPGISMPRTVGFTLSDFRVGVNRLEYLSGSLGNPGQSLPIPMAANQVQTRKQLLSQSIQNNMAATAVQGSANLASALPTIGGLPPSTMPNVVGQNSNLRSIQNVSGISQNSVGNSMGQGVSPSIFANTNRQMPGSQQVVPQQQQSQNPQQQYLYQQQLQQQLMKQKFQQGGIPNTQTQSYLQQKQAQNQQNQILPPSSQLQSSQQSVMQHSVMQPAPVSDLQQNQQSSVQQSTQPMLQQSSLAVLRQHQQQQQQLLVNQSGNSSMQTTHSVHMLQQSRIPLQQQNHQGVAILLPTQGQQSEPQPPEQQLLSQIQSQPGELQQQGLQKPNSLQRDMQKRLQTLGPLLLSQNMIDQQKQLFQSQRPIPKASSRTHKDPHRGTHIDSGSIFSRERRRRNETLKFFPSSPGILKRSLSTMAKGHNILDMIVDHRPIMNPVRHQGIHNNGWALQVAAALEAVYRLGLDEKVILAPQELVDLNFGHNLAAPQEFVANDLLNLRRRGRYDMALPHAVRYGLSLEEDYPYRGNESVPKLHTRHLRRILKADGYGEVPLHREDLLERAVFHQPVIVRMEIQGFFSFFGYKGGIYKPVYVEDKPFVQTGLLVGYGFLDSKPIWALRTPFGAKWGPYGGHIFLPRQSDCSLGPCSILHTPQYPILRNQDGQLWGNALNSELINYLCMSDGDRLLASSDEDYLTKLVSNQFQKLVANQFQKADPK